VFFKKAAGRLPRYLGAPDSIPELQLVRNLSCCKIVPELHLHSSHRNLKWYTVRNFHRNFNSAPVGPELQLPQNPFRNFTCHRSARNFRWMLPELPVLHNLIHMIAA
jgi:hypothetical protein